MPFAVFDLQQWPRQQQSSSSLAPSPVRPAWRAASACPASLPPFLPPFLLFLLFLRSREHNERGHHFKPPQLSEGPLHHGLRPVAAQACWPTTRPTYLLANVRPSVPPSLRPLVAFWTWPPPSRRARVSPSFEIWLSRCSTAAVTATTTTTTPLYPSTQKRV